MAEEWDEPGAATGDRLNPRDIMNHLLIIWVVDYIAHSPTRFTVQDRPSDVIVCDVVDLDLPDEFGHQGALYRKVWWRQARLIGSLKDRIGARLLSRMSKGTASSGFNAPFELVSMVHDADCLARGDAWRRAHPNFVPSKPGRSEMLQDLRAAEATIQPQTVVEPTMLERMAGHRMNDQAQAGVDRLRGVGELPPLPPPPPPAPAQDRPPF